MNAIIETKTFEQRMMDRVKESVGELMSDEDLKKIVEKGIEQAFFTPKITGSSYNQKIEDCLAVKMVQEVLRDQLRLHITQWLKENPDKLEEALKSALQKGFGDAVIAALNTMFQGAMYDLQQNITNQFMR